MRRDRDVRRAATKAKHRAATKARDERKRIALDQQLDQLHQRVEQPATIGSQQTVKLSVSAFDLHLSFPCAASHETSFSSVY